MSTEFRVLGPLEALADGTPAKRADCLLDDSQLEAKQVANLTQTRDLMPDSEGDMMCRAFGAPGVEKRGWCRREADPRVRVSDAERRARDRFTLSHNQLQSAGRRTIRTSVPSSCPR